MQSEQIKQMIENNLPGVVAEVSGDGHHFTATVSGAIFEGKSRVEQQKIVYAALGDNITNGMIHALSLKILAHSAKGI